MGPAAWLAGAWAVFPALLGFLLLARLGPVAEWLKSHQSLGVAVYIAAFVLTAGLGLLPTYAQAILAGFAFGLVGGIPAALAGFTGAALLGYAVARAASGQRVEAEIARRPQWKLVRDALLAGSFWKDLGIVTLVRLPPNSPFALTNWVLAATRTHPLVVLLGTAIGMLPRTAIAVFVGSQLSEWSNPERPRWVFFATIASAAIVVFILIHIGKRALARATAAPAPDRVTP
jgi:uncharacterized membrane protein YdjX (TVP38/TMEM64 family)